MRTLLLALALTAVAAAQVPPPAAVPAPAGATVTIMKMVNGQPAAEKLVIGADGVSTPAAKDGTKPKDKDAKPGEAKVEPPKLTPRAEKLKAIQFDRRPSAVLKAWAPEPKPDPAKPAAKVEPLDAEIAAYKTAVVLADWPRVKAYLAGLPDEEATLAYRQTLTALQNPPNQPPGGPQGEVPQEVQMMMMQGGNMQQYAERNSFSLPDVFGLAAAAPKGANPAVLPPRAAVLGGAATVAKAPAGLDKGHLAGLGAILAQTVQGGTLPEVAVARFKDELAKPGSPFTKREVAKLLTAANLQQYAGDFLPTSEEAVAAKDGEALNLLARHFLARHVRGKATDTKELEKAWHAVQAVLTFPGASREEQDESLLRAVELAPKVTAALGQAWLDDSFTTNPDRGMEILAKVGTLASTGLPGKPFQPDDRLSALKLMRTAVDALLKAAPDKAKGWQQALTLLAAGWLKEADFSRQYARGSGEPRMQQDQYGNIFYGSGGDDDEDNNPWMRRFNQNPNMPRPIPVAEVMKARPSDGWVAAVDPGFRPKLAGLLAQLHLKAGEEELAFPLIEALAPAQPDQAKELVAEFVRVWARNHNPNTQRNRYRYQWFFYGVEQRAEGIPLTRSKQERNLEDLAKWAARIRKLPVGEVDEDQLVTAFTACHSTAEVYKTAAVESVFGSLGTMKPKTLAGLAQQMRSNLAGLWRTDEEQQQKKTNRKKKDIEAEVLRGYEVARKTVADGLARHPGHWSLVLADAALQHDEVNYRGELNKSGDFSAKRQTALDRFAEAGRSYAAEVPKLQEAEYTTQPFELWLYAALGAVDLGSISEDKTFAAKEPAKVKALLDALPGEGVAEKHRAKFANLLFTRMSGAKPHVKFRYLKAGFEIAGDHPRASEAKKVFDYYKDLVKEITLVTEVDGSAKVGHGRPFGLFVNLQHTRDIEREGGGFGKYLQNQNSGSFSYNYGRPTADYKDRFEQAAKEALKEQFEVLSVTFQSEAVTSRAMPEFGWRYTPYAYILLKPRGPQVDAVPQLRIDLDFLDTSGYVVLPVESPKLSIDASQVKPEPRPVKDVQVIQTLDERQANKGQLFLEVKAQATGLLPDLDDLTGAVPAGFAVTKTDDQGLLVKKFAEDGTGNAILSERTWLLTLKGEDGQAELPTSFTFPAVKLPTKATEGTVFQRYVDADLAAVAQTVTLEALYGTKRLAVSSTAFAGAAAVAGLVLAAVGLVVARVLRPAAVAGGVRLPDTLTPFSVARLLTDVRPTVPAARRAELDRDLEVVERGYFADGSGDRPDLRRVAEKWAAVV